MARKIFTDEFVNNALKMFDGTKSLSAVAKELGVNADNLSKAIRAQGIPVPKAVYRIKTRKNLPDDEVVVKYAAGVSELELSKEYGVSRTLIRRILKSNNVDIRNQSEAGFVSATRLPVEFRKKRAQAAHDAIRGIKRRHDELVARALNAMNIECRVGKGEDEFADLLNDAGIAFIRQKPAERYNIDFAIGNVAVELKSGISSKGGATPDKNSGRLEKLIELGYRPLYVCFTDVNALMASFDQIISEVNVLSGLPSFAGKYRVIGCRLQDYAIVRNERQQFSRVPAPIQLYTSVCDFDV